MIRPPGSVRRRSTRLAFALVAAGAIVAAGCGGTENGGTASDDSTPAAGEAGELLMTLDGEDQEHRLTSCTSDAARVTFQGGDGDGRAVVATLSADGSGGTVTISDRTNAWVAGDAAGEPLADLEVSASTASGSGTFVVQQYGTVEDGSRPVEDTGETVEGSFEVTCEI
jgi:hypothetical protein